MYEELVKLLRDYGRDCENGNEMCKNCTIQHFCENGWTPVAIADAIENLDYIAQTYAETVHELEEANRWTPVTERLPQEWWPVLGLIQFHDEKEPPAQEVLWYLGNGHWRETWRGDMIESAVTHWMPLPNAPEPPKEET